LEERFGLTWLVVKPTVQDWLRHKSGWWDSSVTRKRRIVTPESSLSFQEWLPEGEVTRATYRTFLDTWIAAGRCFEEWRKQNPGRYRLLLRAINERQSSLHPEPDGTAHVRWMQSDVPAPLDEATWLACEQFIELVTSQYCKAVCKCDRCGNYYLNTSRRRRKRYCSQRCGSIATATESMSRRRQKERQAKLKSVARALGKWQRLQPASTGDWKTWVSEHACVTRKWLTRAVNRGDVQAPPQK
jgi:hypothetical protein